MNDKQIVNIIEDVVGNTETHWSIVNKLIEDYGFQKLGNGVSATAFEHPSDSTKIIRISAVQGDEWSAFILFARENPCAAFPVVHYMRTCSKHMVVTIMERLKDSVWKGHEASSSLGRHWKEHFHQTLPQFFDPESCRVLAKMYNTLGAPDDLGYWNYMERMDGSLVITDPYHCSGSAKNNPKYNLSRYPVGKRTTVEVRTVAQQFDDNAILAEFCAEVAAEREKEDRMLRANAKHVDHAQPERLYRTLFPQLRDGWIREGGAPHLKATPRKERIEFRPDWRLRGKVAPNFLHAVDFAKLERLVGFRPDLLMLDSIGVPKPVRHKPEPIFRVEYNARPEGRQASVPGKRPKKWEAAVPCQKAAAERKRERAEIYRKLHRRAA